MPLRLTSVLVVDDEQSLRDFVRRNLEVRKYHVHTATNGMEALAIFKAQSIDLAVVDLMMPHMDGIELIRRIRQVSYVPIIVLSALDEEEDRIRALQIGADDYLTKPFGIKELLARIEAVLRRAEWTIRPSNNVDSLIRGELVADLSAHTVTLSGEKVELTPIEFDLLVYLMENTGRALTHQMILQHVWGESYGQEVEYLRVYIGRLRQKIEADPVNPRYLLTVRGVGYTFES